MTGKKAASRQSGADKRKGKGVAATATATATATAVKKSDADIHISEDWLNGHTRHKEAVIPVFWAREELKGCREEAARRLWALIDDCFNQWKAECGTPPQLFHSPSRALSGLGPEPVDPSKIEPWFCAEPWVSVDLLEHLERTKYPPFMDITSEIPIRKLLAAAILHEVSIGDHEGYPLGFALNPFAGHSANCHIIAAMKAERKMLIKRLEETLNSLQPHLKSAKAKKELLALGRQRGAQANKEKAAQRQQAIRDAAIYFFVNNPQATVEKCAEWIKAEAKLKCYRSYGNGKELSVDRIEKAIAGTKDEALVFLAQRRSALT